MKKINFTPILVFIFGFLLLFNSVEYTLRIEPTPIKKSVFNPKHLIKNKNQVIHFPESNSSPILKTKDSKNVKLNKLKIHSTIKGAIAVTQMEMTFYNELNRNLEAELNFPLEEGQTITHFEMDVNGKMRIGVAIEKEKARVAFESTIRKNIDPGLVEMTKGNNFKARVFPVPSHGTKKIIIEYTEELKSSDRHSYFYLPLNFEQNIPSFELKIDVVDQENQLLFHNLGLKDLKFKKLNNNYSTYFKGANLELKKALKIKIPIQSNQPKTIVSTNNNSTFFHSTISIPNISIKKEKIKSISVLWDVSGSREKSDTKLELNFLKSYLKKLKNVTVELIPFANQPLSTKNIEIHNGNTQKIEDQINAFNYDGGTILTAIPFEKCKGQEILLFSDGLENLGSIDQLKFKKRIYTIQSSSSSDPSLLQSLSMKSNGEFIHLLNESNESAVRKITEDQLHFLGFEPNENLVEFYPSSGTANYGGLAISGKLKSKNTNLKALFGFGNKIYTSKIIQLSNLHSINRNSDDLEKLFIIKKINELNLNYKFNKKEITALGIQYKLVTKNTSLLVLDRLEDYIEHKITPPIELQKAYFSRIKKEKQNTKKERKAHLNEVSLSFKDEVKWWNRKNYKIKKNKNTANDSEAEVDMMNMEIAPPTEQTIAFEAPIVSDEVVESFASFNVSSNASKTLSVERKGVISIEGWNPKSPYLTKIKALKLKDSYAVYLQLKKKYGKQPSFYLDVADYYLANNEQKLGLRILSNIAELELENHGLLRILAQKLLQLHENELAISLFEELVELRNELPQSHRDLGLAYAASNLNQKAIEKLYYVVSEPFDDRFNGIQLIALNEINNIIATSHQSLDVAFIDKRFIKNLPVDIRVILNWDADNTDVDLWVTDPNGEKCFYSHKITSIGGKISNDFTQGFGPEEFMIKNAKPGKYKVQANYYGSSSQSIQGKATLTVQFFKQYGTSVEKKEEITRRLNVTKEVLNLGTFRF